MNQETSDNVARPQVWKRNLAFIGFVLLAVGAVIGSLWSPAPLPAPREHVAAKFAADEFQDVVQRVDAEFSQRWNDRGLQAMDRADDQTIMRRLALGLAGTVPSLQEVRAFAAVPAEERIQWWLSYLFEDRRTSTYLAERLARATVGVENGPFLVYRRRRMVSWLADEIAANRPYDALVRNLVNSEGVWTTEPEVNFITATMMKDPETNKNRPDVVRLAARTTRAFLGVRIDCVECHDDKFGDRWKQEHFHEFAAFYAQADVGLTGVRDQEKRNYHYRYLNATNKTQVPPVVPFQPELLPPSGTLRERLAGWITHPQNRSFARTTVNRVWALLFNRPMLEPIDDIPLEGNFPPGMETLADDFIANGFDLRRLIRVIAASRPFQIASQSADETNPVTSGHEYHWAAFPLTRLRPDQVAGSILQAANLRTIDAEAHIIERAIRFFGEQEFVKRYGDFGEDEFGEHAGTIPQRLLMLNGKLVHERISDNLVLNASTRIGALSPSDETAVRTAYLCTLTREPSDAELEHFTRTLEGRNGKQRNRAMADLYWALMNSTEFSWHH